MSMSELAWFKSSYSGSEGDSCVEVAVSQADADTAQAVHVRDSKHRHGPRLTLTPTAWHAFLGHAVRS
ncbi:DUF397 domain-containing protein [Streptomyces sp. SCSIO 75703]|uniref:DUF397 domain-containing protein n=1 Tax=Streptomyces sp. SCSIO 75703 TaxID=3112165 RepID=UPI0030D01079